MAVLDTNSDKVGTFNGNIGSNPLPSETLPEVQEVELYVQLGQNVVIPYSITLLEGEKVNMSGDGIAINQFPDNVVTNTKDKQTTLNFELDFGVITESNLGVRTLTVEVLSEKPAIIEGPDKSDIKVFDSTDVFPNTDAQDPIPVKDPEPVAEVERPPIQVFDPPALEKDPEPVAEVAKPDLQIFDSTDVFPNTDAQKPDPIIISEPDPKPIDNDVFEKELGPEINFPDTFPNTTPDSITPIKGGGTTIQPITTSIEEDRDKENLF